MYTGIYKWSFFLSDGSTSDCELIHWDQNILWLSMPIFQNRPQYRPDAWWVLPIVRLNKPRRQEYFETLVFSDSCEMERKNFPFWPLLFNCPYWAWLFVRTSFLTHLVVVILCLPPRDSTQISLSNSLHWRNLLWSCDLNPLHGPLVLQVGVDDSLQVIGVAFISNHLCTVGSSSISKPCLVKWTLKTPVPQNKCFHFYLVLSCPFVAWFYFFFFLSFFFHFVVLNIFHVSMILIGVICLKHLDFPPPLPLLPSI